MDVIRLAFDFAAKLEVKQRFKKTKTPNVLAMTGCEAF